MEYPRPPSWFVKKLREFDKCLCVFFNPGPKKWEIAQIVRWPRYEGEWEGKKIYSIAETRKKVMWVDGLGSKVFEWLKEQRLERFKNYRDMMEKLKIQGYEQLYNRISPARS